MITTLRPRLRVLLAVATVLTATALTARPAAAHGPDGEMTLLRAEQTAPAQAQIEIGLLYGNDAEVAEEATVTVTLTGPDGSTVGPVPAPRAAGARYVADVELPAPGSWAFTVTSTTPTASVTGTVEMAPAVTTTTPPTTPTTAAPPAGSLLQSTGGSSSANPTAASDTGSSSGLVLVVLLLGALAVAVAGGLVLRRRGAADREIGPGSSEAP